MAKQEINLGTGPNTGTGEPIRSAFQKVNENFTEVYDISGLAFDSANDASILAQSAFDAANNASGGSADTGNITFNGATISTDETEQTIIIEALDDDGEWNTQFTLNPEDVVAKMSAREEDIESFNSGNWGTATWTNEGGDNKIVFTDAPDLRKFLQSSIWDNGGDAGTRQININFTDRFDYDGFDFTGDDVTLFLTFGPAEPAESVDNIEFFWINESRIAVDQNDFEEIQIFGRGIGMVVNVTQDIDIRSGDDIDIRAEDDMSIRAIDRLVLDGDRVRIRSRSSDDTVEITTDYEDDEYTWQFRENGTLRLPANGLIAESVVTENPTIELTPANPDVESQKLVIKGGFPIGEETHVHLTTGDLQETSIFLGTDEHNVRTNIDGVIEITSRNYDVGESNTWAFDSLGNILFPDGSTQSTAFVLNPDPIFDYTITNSLRIEEGVQESYSNLTSATGVVTHNCANGQIFYHTSPSDNFTANFTNLQLENGYATSLTLVISQGGTGYIANTVLIDNSSTTIRWQGNTEPTPNVNSIDVISFSVIKTGFNNGDVIVLGQLSTFG